MKITHWHSQIEKAMIFAKPGENPRVSLSKSELLEILSPAEYKPRAGIIAKGG